jgi:hypothetical protein
VKLDESIVRQARNADVISFLEGQGFTFTLAGGAYRCREHKSLAVKSDRRSWYRHSMGVGGDGALDYLIKAENMPFRDAVSVLLASSGSPVPSPAPTAPEQPRTLVLPENRGISLRLYDYLCVKRGIDSTIVHELMQKEMLYEDTRGNVVFIGHDENGRARFASLRGTSGDCAFRMDCAGSDKRYGFNMAAHAPSERLYIFESPIDAMSHASLENAATGDTEAWKRHSRLSLAGTSDAALPFFLNQHKSVRELVFCLDNDAPGRAAALSLARKYAQTGLRTRLELPEGKDYNEDLQAQVKRVQAQKRLERQTERHTYVPI